jgi:methanogenic corrinoid protein MtbC1
VLDRLLATATLETVLGDVVIPYLHELGERWASGEVSVAQEHFATAVVRGRLLGLARGWGLGIGPQALLACLPGERHDVGLLAFGLALRAQGWRIVYLGPDTPLETVAQAASRVKPSLVVLSATTGEHVPPVVEQLRALASDQRIALGGEAALSADLEGVLALTGDPVTEAARVAALVRDGALAAEAMA